MNVTFTDKELTRIRRAYNIEEKNTGFQIKTNEDMRNEIIVEAYVSGVDAFFYVDSDSVAEILNNNPDVNQEAERGSDKFEYELDRIYRVVNTEEPEEALWYFILQGFSEAGGFHGMKSKDLCATAQEALDAGEERVIELNKMTFEQQSKELW
jgi:hypothetical protein